MGLSVVEAVAVIDSVSEVSFAPELKSGHGLLLFDVLVDSAWDVEGGEADSTVHHRSTADPADPPLGFGCVVSLLWVGALLVHLHVAFLVCFPILGRMYCWAWPLWTFSWTGTRRPRSLSRAMVFRTLDAEDRQRYASRYDDVL